MRRPWRWLLVCAPGVVLLGLVAWALWPAARGSALAMEHLARVRAWQAPGAQPPAMETWFWTRLGLARALEATPQDADLHEAMAYLYMSAAFRPGQAPMVQRAYLEQSVKHLDQAVQARPMAPLAWANRALALHTLASDEARHTDLAPMWEGFDRALAYGQRDGSVQAVIGSVAFGRWEQLDAGRRNAVLTMFMHASVGQRRTLRALANANGVALGG